MPYFIFIYLRFSQIHFHVVPWLILQDCVLVKHLTWLVKVIHIYMMSANISVIFTKPAHAITLCLLE